MNSVIVVKELKKDYPLPRKSRKGGESVFHALKGISFEVEKGEIFGVLGPNGAGKTTTLEILETIRIPTSGTATILGLDILTHAREVKRRIGVQLQSSEYLPSLSLTELLEMFHSIYKTEANIQEILEFVGLTEKTNDEVKNLSGGQKQRFTIATSLVSNPEILFLDEPTTGLDPAARRSLWALIKKLQTRGLTIVMTTHYMEEAEFLCDRVAILDHGEILKINKPRTLIDDLRHTTQISFFAESEVDTKVLEKFPGVEKVYSNNPKVILELTSLDHVGTILQQLRSNKIQFTGFTLKTATLEDVYLDLTGKEFES